MVAETEIQTLAHDLKNVFQTILQAADLIALDSAHSEVAGIIARSVEQARRILASALQPGGSVLLAPAVDAAVQFTRDFSSMTNGPAVHAEVDVNPDLCLSARPGPFERSLMNLFINALEAARSAGRPCVELRVSAQETEGEVSIRVEDDGPGIPSAVLERVFEPGVSASPSGQGLGLHIVENAMSEFGGAVTAANAERGGAVFIMRLPRAKRAFAASSRP